MSITVVSGLPGSGKSTMLIEAVNAAREQDRSVVTFACSESAWLRAHKMIGARRLLSCRRHGLTCPLDHFVPTAECAAILDGTPSGALAVFEEAHAFAPTIVPHWVEASRRGIDVLVAQPSKSQRQLLEGYAFEETLLAMQCRECDAADASMFVWLADPDVTVATCATCHLEMQSAARRQVLDLLTQHNPSQDERVLHVPIELEEYSDWTIIRSDSKRRLELVRQMLREAQLPVDGSRHRRTYLDVGCSTGYFCHNLRLLGFRVEGVDVLERHIRVARLLDSFYRKDFSKYAVSDVYTYLHETRERRIDVTSAFDASRWMSVESPDRRIAALELLFAKTNRLCFLEMGHAWERHDRGPLPVDLDRSWVQRVMEEMGGFAEIRVFEAGEYELLSDIFLGIKAPSEW